MKNKDFYNVCKKGRKPLIKMNENIHEFAKESFDPGMMGRVVEVNIECENNYRLLIDMNGYEGYNHSVAIKSWKEGLSENKVGWLDTPYYPRDGLKILYVPKDEDISFEVVEG